ncbi:acetoin utilization deacetylase AcuC-like enzyme [Hymenobacter luteus]|uniref:Acetoin utilization deacetylase AcuC-like enzyme n=2 Tax=Hymenobacter TaxID=89966 RepID=A0A7W9SXX8_9BACT|nr:MULTISPECIES: histone deacetylase [Hymenobacter]MBB4599733.1 acetoin utilization deacetylase AcuC-like enzyme [Hymenobacter latericoloratus]MBB6057957.1 acetoin utilization deacetylase AcuC-like enzyme [Hymenobacter luteus]
MLSIAWAPLYAHPLPANHRFPMLKYELLPEQLLREGIVPESAFFLPQPPPDEHILRVHAADYYQRLRTGQLTRPEERATGFPWSPALIMRETTILGGTLECARRARQHGVALNIAGGTHHAFRGRGEGFCLLNDQAAAAAYLLAQPELGVERVLIVDLDVHQGNGTASIFQHEPRVFTFSMHGARNYPHRKEQSDLDLALPDGTDDAAYLDLLRETLPRLLDQHRPDFVFYLSGVDVLATDKLGHLALSREGCRRRDEYVLGLCHQHQLPVVVCMGGGYSPRIADIVDAHVNTFRAAAALWG